MQIKTVKELKNGYSVNSSMFVPTDPANKDYQAIQSWIASGGVVEAYDSLTESKAEKISQIKSAAADLILATYPTYKQLNNLMSQDSALIDEMNTFISQIRTKSNELEAALDGLSAEEINNYPIQFIS